jgi:ABC-2 type transport system ATP-binding protein
VKAVVEVYNLCKQFGSIKALKNLSLTVEEGEIFGLLGPNGSGKTTLIRLLLGLLKPSSGYALVLGKRVPSLNILGQIGYMTQLEALYHDLTVEENLYFFATISGLHNPKERKKRIQEVLELVALTERRKSVVGTLSGGMKQRLSLACALVHSPQLLFLDEPTVGVDPELRHAFWRHFTNLSREGVSIVISSHNLDEVERCHRLAFLKEGSLIACGSPSELKKMAKARSLEEAYLFFAQSENVLV